MACRSPVPTDNGVHGCGKCDFCLAKLRRFWLGRIAAEMHTSKLTWMVTATYDEQHVDSGRSLPRDHWKVFLANLRRKHPCKQFSVGEYGTRTARPHWHGLIMFQDTVPDVPLGFDTINPFWKKGNSRWEVPRSVAGSISYLYDYFGKDNAEGGVKYGVSPGMGLRYLLNWARLQARNRRFLTCPYGIRYTVPGVVKRSGGPWEYFIPFSSPYAVRMAEMYILEWQALWDEKPDWAQLDRINCDDPSALVDDIPR